jgi:hypothetical protein
MLVSTMEAGMKRDQSFQRGAHGCLLEIAAAILAVFAMLAISANYRNFGDDFACNGRFGLGFPVSYLCDYGTGGSPISSWGRVDLADFPYFSPLGLFTDILFYAGILWIGWLVRRAFRHNDSYPIGNTIWVACIGIAFLVGFLSAAAIFRSERINFHDYLLGIPTPVPATPTPMGTPPPPEERLIPTPGP